MAEQNNTEMESVAQERERMRSEESRLRRLKRKRQRRERAKRLLIAAFCLIIAVVIGLGVFIAGRFENRATENTLTLKSDGSLIFEEIEDISKNGFDKAEVKSYIKDQIDSYNKQHGKGSIKLQRFVWGEDKVYARTKYKDIDIYSNFTGYVVYNGDLVGALAKDKLYPTTSAKKIVDGKMTGDDATSSDMEGKNVFIIKENTVVKVPGKIVAATNAGVELLSEDTIRITSVSDEDDAALSTVIVYE